eukprot:sb/3467961/
MLHKTMPGISAERNDSCRSGDEGDRGKEPTEIRSKQPIRTRYLGHVTGYQPIRDQYFQLTSILNLCSISHFPQVAKKSPLDERRAFETSTLSTTPQLAQVWSSPFTTAAPPTPCLQEGEGDTSESLKYQLIWIDDVCVFHWTPIYWANSFRVNTNEDRVMGRNRGNKKITNQNSLFMSLDWLSANQGPVFLIRSVPAPPPPPTPRLTAEACLHILSDLGGETVWAEEIDLSSVIVEMAWANCSCFWETRGFINNGVIFNIQSDPDLTKSSGKGFCPF